MSAPGGFGEGAHGDETNPPPPGGRDDWTPPWDPPAIEYPAYSPPGYPPGYPPAYPVAYPPPAAPPGHGPPQYGAPPPGYAPPPYPGGYPAGYPVPGPPAYPGGYYGMPDYRVNAGTNGFAIASLVSSFSGFFCCFIGSIAAIVLGAIAMNQIKETRQEGYGLAVTGIVIGVGTLVVFLIAALFSIRSH